MVVIGGDAVDNHVIAKHIIPTQATQPIAIIALDAIAHDKSVFAHRRNPHVDTGEAAVTHTTVWTGQLHAAELARIPHCSVPVAVIGGIRIATHSNRVEKYIGCRW